MLKRRSWGESNDGSLSLSLRKESETRKAPLRLKLKLELSTAPRGANDVGGRIYDSRFMIIDF